MHLLISKKDDPKIVYYVQEVYLNLDYSQYKDWSDLDITKDLAFKSRGNRLVVIFGQDEPIYVNPNVDDICINNIEIKLSDLLKEVYSKPENIRPIQWAKEIHKKYKVDLLLGHEL